MIRVENVSKSFGSKKALHQISFEIKEGEIFGFLGPSGSGKTTMINVLTGQLAADQGKTVLLGKNSQDLTSMIWNKLVLLVMEVVFMKR